MTLLIWHHSHDLTHSEPQSHNFTHLFIHYSKNELNDDHEWRIVQVYDLRADMQFVYYRSGQDNEAVAVSNAVSFPPFEPLQAHLSVTSYPNEMRLMWVSDAVSWGDCNSHIRCTGLQYIQPTFICEMGDVSKPFNSQTFWYVLKPNRITLCNPPSQPQRPHTHVIWCVASPHLPLPPSSVATLAIFTVL